ncbi:MAG: antibiotic biosynthesis monooxygenase [Parvularculaceae bacterium]
MMSRFAENLTPPYMAVIFTNHLTSDDPAYGVTAARMVELAQDVTGFLGLESTRDEDGFGITVSYWRDVEAIKIWRAQVNHLAAQAKGKSDWYQHYEVRIARVERAYSGPEGRS